MAGKPSVSAGEIGEYRVDIAEAGKQKKRCHRSETLTVSTKKNSQIFTEIYGVER
jgi:hypothetical protein